MKKGSFMGDRGALYCSAAGVFIAALASLAPAPLLAQGCSFGFGASGPPNWSSPEITARHALDDAWARHVDYNMDNGGNAYREFGGWIYENEDGSYGYTTPRRGDESGLGLNDLVSRQSDGGYTLNDTGRPVVGAYHIHPENARGARGERWANSRFSGDDKDLAETYDVPNYLRHSRGYVIYDPATNSPSDPPNAWRALPEPPPSRSSGGCSVAAVGGEPHLTSHDGRQFKFQGAGEYLALADPADGLEVMLRLEPYLDFRSVSILTALAVKTGDARIGVYKDAPHIRVNGAPMEDSVKTFGDGASVERAGNTARIRTAQGDAVIVSNLGGASWLDAGVRLAQSRKGRPRGLWGDFDGARDNDLTTRGGDVIEFFSADADEYHERLYRQWGDSWRIGDAESLFDYASGVTSDDFQLLDFPEIIAAERQVMARPGAEDAIERCRSAGIAEPALLANCAYDVSLTGAPAFASSYKAFADALAILSSEEGLEPLDVERAIGGDDAAPDELISGRIMGGFSNAEETLHLVGAAAPDASARLALTPARANERGGVFLPQPVYLEAGFTATFDLVIESTGGAGDRDGSAGGEGLAYVITSALPDALSGPAAGLGYAGLADVVAIEFDTFGNDHDGSSMHVSVNARTAGESDPVYRDSASSLASAAIASIDDGAKHRIKINWIGGRLAVYVDDMSSPDLDAPLDLDDYFATENGGHVGVTAATGEAFQAHMLTFWSHWSYSR